MGVTIHSTWVRKLGTSPKREDYSVQKDYQNLVKSMKNYISEEEFKQVNQLFSKMLEEHYQETWQHDSEADEFNSFPNETAIQDTV